MSDIDCSEHSISNTNSGYDDNNEHGQGWVFDAIGDRVTYSTNTLDAAVTLS